VNQEKLSLLISLVVPIYNDGALAEEFCADVEAVFQRVLGTEAIENDVEVIFVNDGSRDDSFEVLRDVVCEKFKCARVVDLSRNFGQHVAISAGYRHARGDYVACLNVDREDPPDQIPLVLEVIRKGEHDFVGGRYKQRDVPFFSRLTSKIFMWVLNRLTGYEVPLDMAMLRVMNRRFVDAYNPFTERSRYLPGLESWLGFRRTWVLIDHRKRTRGKSSYNFRRRFMLAFNTILSFSDLPLRISVVLGMLVALLGFAMNIFLVITKIFFVGLAAGFTATISIIVLLAGVQILVMGVAGLYIGRVMREVQGRPLYVVRATHNIEPS
jgi:glycosyltransferase involved in cell wall biosynthesis